MHSKVKDSDSHLQGNLPPNGRQLVADEVGEPRPVGRDPQGWIKVSNQETTLII